eukprot:s1821_g3.t1
MAEKVPILVGMRTLTRLGAIIDVPGGWLVLTQVDPTVKVPLQKSAAGHLLVDLTQDWMAQGQPLQGSHDGVYMVLPLQSDECCSSSQARSSGFNMSVMSTAELQLLVSSQSDAVMMLKDDSMPMDDDHVQQLCDEATGLVVDPLGHEQHHSLHAPQDLRDQVMSSLAHAHQPVAPDPSSGAAAHGAQEADGGGQGDQAETSGHRTLRLQQNAASGCSGPKDDRSTLLRLSHGGETGAGQPQRLQQVRNLGRMSNVRPTSVLHTGIRGDGSNKKGRAVEGRRRSSTEPDSSQRTTSEQTSEEREDHDGRSRGLSTPEVGAGAGAEEEVQCRAGRQGSNDEGIPEIPSSSKGGGFFGDYSPDEEEQEARDDSRGSPECSGRSGKRSRRLDADPVMPDLPGHGTTRFATEFANQVSPTSPPSSPMMESPVDEKYWDFELYEAAEEGILPDGSNVNGQQLSQQHLEYLYAATEDAERDVQVAMDELGLRRNREPFKVLELCCEADSGISEAVEKLGGKAIRCGLHNGCDLLRESGVVKVMQIVEEEKPDVIWVSFPCGPTSSIQELNKLTAEGREKIRKKVVKSRKLVSNGVRVLEQQAASGRHVIQEWPRGNRAWGFNAIKNFWNRIYERQQVYEARVDGCSYGLRVPEGLMKKPWLLRSTTSSVWNLHKLCTKDHEHVPCEGGQRTRLSAFYPPAMCRRVAHVIKVVHEEILRERSLRDQSHPLYTMAATPLEGDPDSLRDCTDEELMRWATSLLKLHKKLGHPSRQAFTRMLRDRGATVRMLTIANNLHCMDCEEAKMMNPQQRGFTIETAENLWDVVQMDNFEFTYGDQTYHWQLMVDEASGYAVANFLGSHNVKAGYSPSTLEVIQGILKSWIQYFGYPKCFKLDKEGGHRGRDLEQWGDTHGVEMEFVPAEAHGQIGKVESLIGNLKQKLQTHLRGEESDPISATWAMVAAHNSVSRRGGFSPIQWVFGRDFTETQRLHDGPDLPHLSSLSADEKFQRTAALRERAKNKYKELQDLEKLSKAHNMKTTAARAFHPGDLVYYKRHQAPTTAEGRSHSKLDIPRRRVARWFGPARILGLETKVTYNGQVRQPHRLGWIISQGRLKRVHTDQLRHASMREKLTNEEFHDVLATPWTFSDVTSILDKGAYDDLVELPELQRGRTHDVRTSRTSRSMSRGRGGQQKRASSAARPRSSPPTNKPKKDDEKMDDAPPPVEKAPSSGYTPSYLDDTEQHPPGEDEAMSPGLSPVTPTPDADLPPVPSDDDMELPEDVDLERLLDDPTYMPRMEHGRGPLYQHEPFLRARQRHERQEAAVLQRNLPQHMVEQVHYVDFAKDFEDNMIYAVTLPTPETTAEWKAIVKEPSKFVAKQLAKGVEVSWHKLNAVQRQAMAEAKQVEIKEWVASKVVRAAIGDVDPARVMKMRWVLVFKGTDDPKTVKAKARLVVLGFSDPDVGTLTTQSPTMSRRSRQLMLQFSTHKGLPLLKADAKAAFLQGLPTQGKRCIFGKPVEELRQALGLSEHEYVQFMKAAYGLTIAPREFYMMVNSTLQNLELRRMLTDPCVWLYVVEDEPGKPYTLGMIGSHVDDFLMTGREDDPRWIAVLEKFHMAMRWSPWEAPPMVHCGVKLQQYPDFSWRLDQTEFCKDIMQIKGESSRKELTSGELHQARAVLGAVQWRVYQTAPQHAAKLGYYQSMLTKGDRSMLEGINKMVREVHAQKDLGMHIYQLNAEKDDDLVLVAWSDAALANRPDLGSTGGYIIGFVHKSMVESQMSGQVNVMSWGSHKLKRVCRSSLAAEAQALAEAEQELMYLRLEWWEMLGHSINLQDPETAAKNVQGILVIDAKALFDAAQADTTSYNVKEKYTALEVLAMVNHFNNQQTILRWCNSDQQLADGLTKSSAQDKLRKFFMMGQKWNLHFDEEFISAKKRRKLNEPAEDIGHKRAADFCIRSLRATGILKCVEVRVARRQKERLVDLVGMERICEKTGVLTLKADYFPERNHNAALLGDMLEQLMREAMRADDPVPAVIE